ncbi:MAG: ATP-binding protein [Myxococcota bacterium]
MKRSFVRLVIGSVLTCWAIGFVVLVLHARSETWTDVRAERDGVFLVHDLLDQEPATNRAARLRQLQPNFAVDFSLVAVDEVERRVGRSVSPGEEVPLRVSPQEEWYFLVFQDGQGALAAGPVHPAMPPPGRVPIGVIIAIVIVPMIAALLALRVERQLTKVERASQALAVGELSARVDNPQGPSAELAASFNAMAERVERLIRSRDELVQAVSHELGSPLSRLRFHVELLENQSDGEREERLKAMTRELDALDELVAELLAYVQSDELKLDRHAFDPNRGLHDLAELARLESQDDHAVELDLALPNEANIFADPRLFQRAVENILRNAMKYARGNVLLELTEDDEHVRVVVHDDGPGIPKELREKVTVPFFREEAARDRKTGGVGLGLAIVNRILQRHGGRLAIESSPLGGAMVETWWPRGRGVPHPR